MRYLITRASQITHILSCNSFNLVLKNETLTGAHLSHKILNFHCTALEATLYFNDYDQCLFLFSPVLAAINSLQLEISRAYHPKYPSSITESRDNFEKQVIVASGSVSFTRRLNVLRR